MEAIKEYNYRKTAANQGYYMGAFILIVGIIALIVLNKLIVMFFIMSIIFMIMAAINGNLKIVKIFPKHFEVKRGMAASSKLVKNENFKSYEMKGKTMHIHYTSETGEKKTFKLHEKALEEDDFTTFQEYLDTL